MFRGLLEVALRVCGTVTTKHLLLEISDYYQVKIGGTRRSCTNKMLLSPRPELITPLRCPCRPAPAALTHV